MNNANEEYMRARMALNTAIEEFVNTSNKVGFDRQSTASSILDSVYDIDPNLHTEVQRVSLPMVKEFNMSKSLKFDELEKHWVRALVLWEQKKMWRALEQ